MADTKEQNVDDDQELQPLRIAARRAEVGLKSARRYIAQGGVRFEQRGPWAAYYACPADLREAAQRVKDCRRNGSNPIEQGAKPATAAGSGAVEDPPATAIDKPVEPERKVTEQGPPAAKPEGPKAEPARANEGVAPEPPPEPNAHELTGEDLPPPEPIALPGSLSDRVRRAHALSRAQSLLVRRLPENDSDSGLWALSKLPLLISIGKEELLQAATKGGLPLLLSSKLGAGWYEVTYVGTVCVPLHSEIVIVPDPAKQAAQLLAWAREREREARQAQRKAELRRQREREERRRQRELEAAERAEASWLASWEVVIRSESLRRLRWIGNLRLQLLQLGERGQRLLDEIDGDVPDLEAVVARARSLLGRHAGQIGGLPPFDPRVLWLLEPVMPVIPPLIVGEELFQPWSPQELAGAIWPGHRWDYCHGWDWGWAS